MPFLKRHYDKTVAAGAVIIVLLLFAPMAFIMYHAMAKNYHTTIVSMADVGAYQAARALELTHEHGIDIWDTAYREIGYEEFRHSFCTETASIDREYFEWLAGGNRTRYHTEYDETSPLQPHIQCIQDSFGISNPFQIKYAELIDRNGYVPWHGRANKLCTGDKEYDIRNNRQKRIWADALLSAGENISEKRVFFHETDYGEVENIAASPIVISGELWGWFLVAYHEYDAGYDLVWFFICTVTVSALMVGAVFHVYILSAINRIYESQVGKDTRC